MISISPKLLSEYNARTRFGGMEGLAPNSYQSGHPTMVVLLVKPHVRGAWHLRSATQDLK